MAKYTKYELNVPDINRSYSTRVGKTIYSYSNPSVKNANIKMLKKIVNEYEDLIDIWGKEFEIDDSIIASFIATESGGKNAKPNKYDATGLMQVTPKAVWEVIAKWKVMVNSPLSSKAISFFNKIIPSSKNFNPNVLPSANVLNEIIVALEKNSEFNIAIGTAMIRWLLEAFEEDGITNINKVMVSYNAGYYSMRNKVKGKKTTQDFLKNKSIPLESRSYLLKMLGVNGFMQLWVKNIK